MQKRLTGVMSPKAPNHPDRDVDCLLALMPAFRGLVQNAEEAGWTEGEIAASLLALVHVYGDKLPARIELWH